MNTEITIGIDIGGTNTAFGMIDSDKNILYKNLIPTLPKDGVQDFIVRLSKKIKEAHTSMFKDAAVKGIGIAAPGANYLRGTIESAANLPWGSVNIVELMRSHFNVPIALINDANSAALGEQYFGSAMGMKNFVVLTIGTGLGSGIVIDGQLVYGENGLAGEMGHIIIKQDGRLCGCGRKGCAETYISANGICRTVIEILSKKNITSSLREMPAAEITAEKIYQSALMGDSVALEAFSITGDLLGQLISNIIAALDPEAVILSGGLVKAGDLLLKPSIESFNKNLLNLPNRKVKILNSSFNQGESAFLGASCLVGEDAQKLYYDSSGRPVAFTGSFFRKQNIEKVQGFQQPGTEKVI